MNLLLTLEFFVSIPLILVIISYKMYLSNKEGKQNIQEQDATIPETKPEVPKTISAAPEVKDESFTISIKKTVSGEDAQFFLNGVGSTLLKNQQYVIEVKITENEQV